MNEANIEETQEAVATRIEATTIIIQAMSELPIIYRKTRIPL